MHLHTTPTVNLDTSSITSQVMRNLKGDGKRQRLKAMARGRSKRQQQKAEVTFKVMARTSTKSRGRALREPVSAMKSPCEADFQLSFT